MMDTEEQSLLKKSQEMMGQQLVRAALIKLMTRFT
jgi:hypothetical protein